MKKIIILFIALASFLFVAGCWPKADDTVFSTWSVQGFTTTYVVWASPVFQTSLYGTVIADSIKNIVSNRGGMLDYINCQPGKEVSRNTIIAKIIPNEDDMTYQNSQIQLSVLQEQLHNLTTIFSLTEDTLAIQQDILRDQYDNNSTLLTNLNKTEWYTESSLDYQEELLDQQYDTLKAAKNVDLDKMKTSISNAHKQYLIMIKDALKKVNDVFAGSLSVSDKDIRLKQEVIEEYTRLNDKVSDTMSASEFSDYLDDFSAFMSLVASSVNATTPSTNLPQSSSMWTSIDGLYTTFTTLATTFMGSKSVFDTLASSYDSVKNTYNSQIKTLDTNTDNFTDNTAKSTKLQIDNQKASLQLAQKTLANQLSSSDESQAMQLMSLKNQLLTLQQSVAVLSNSLEGEILYAWVEWVVKMRALGEDNKLAPNTLLCQITPTDASNTSIQIFSYQRLALGSKVAIADQWGQFLWTWIVLYEYPYKDPVTQNYIYEIPVVKFSVKENERVSITLSQSADKNDIWIPLQYVSPRLEGYLVRRKAWSGVQNIYVKLGNINNEYIQVLSGLNMWDEIVQ